MAVMKIGCEVEQQLVITLEFEDGNIKSSNIGKGDYVSIAYNKNGLRTVINGIVTTIYANPYNARGISTPCNCNGTKNDWYLIVSDDETGAVAKININNILDIDVLKQNKFGCNVMTPNNSTRVTHIRIFENVLQVSPDQGATWYNVGSDGTLNDNLVGYQADIAKKIKAMIGSDQYSSSDELVAGIVDLVNEEAKKRQMKVSTASALDASNRNVDATPGDSYDIHGYRQYTGKNIDAATGAVNHITYV